MRDTYAKYIRSTKTKTGQAATKAKVWVWAHHMEAFRPFLTFAKTISNVSKINSVPSTSESVTVSLDDNFEAETIQLHSDNNSIEDTVDTELQDAHPQVINSSQSPHITPSALEPPDVATPTTIKVPTKEKKGKKVSQPSSSVGDVIKYFETKNKREHDAIDSLMLAHAKTIKTFSGRRQVITKMKIAQVIMEQELLHQEELAASLQQNNALSRPESVHSYYQNCSTSTTPSPCSSIACANDSRSWSMQNIEQLEGPTEFQTSSSEANPVSNFVTSFDPYV